MVDTSSSATGTYGEGVKWILAIAAAAIAGAFVHLSEIKQESIGVQGLVALSLIAFVYSIWTGMYYLLWLNTVPLVRDRIKQNEEELTAVPITDVAKKAEIEGRIAKQRETIKISETAMPSWYKHYTYSFSTALVCATVALLLSMVMNAASEKATKASGDHNTISHPHYSLALSAVHATGKGREAHTFLINDETGDLWQMVCDKGGHVAFQKVKRIDTPLAQTSSQ
jgi:hypothetical protein